MASGGAASSLRLRAPRVLAFLAFLACICLVLVPMTDPTAAISLSAAADEQPAEVDEAGQRLTAEDGSVLTADRAQFNVTRIQVAPVVPAAGIPDPGTAQAIAYDMVIARGWSEAEYACLYSLWNKESHWNVNAHNAKSGAHGIPQALPGEKMASVGADWATNPTTQITWGLGYIEGRYGTPCGAWASSQSRGWY